MTWRRRAAAALGLAACVAAGAGASTWSAFSSTTGNAGNSITAGTVYLSDNDAGSALLSLSSAMPGASSTACINVTYGGSLDADVRLYASVAGALAPHLTLTVTRGTDSSPSFSSCSGFSADASDYIGAGPGVVYQGPLSSYPAGWATGVVDAPGAPDAWSSGESRAYRIRVAFAGDPAAEALTATATLTWEARNR